MRVQSLDTRSEGGAGTVNRVLASQQSANAAEWFHNPTLVDVLDQVGKSVTVGELLFDRPAQACRHFSLRRRALITILQRICCLQVTLPRSCVLSGNISKEGDIAFATGWFGDVWKGHNNQNSVCIKALRVYEPRNLSEIKQVCDKRSRIWCLE